MSRNGWLVAAGSVAFLLFAVVLLQAQRAFHPRVLSAPVAVVEGEAPAHGFAGINLAPTFAPRLVISSVVKGSGADAAGLLPNDEIVAVNGKANPNLAAFQGLIKASQPGDDMNLTIRHNAEDREVHLRLIGFVELVQLQERQGMDGEQR